MKAFRAITAFIATALVISALMHVILLASDSADYRRWVSIQIALQLIGAGLLWYVRKFMLGALLAFALLSGIGIYINAVYVNYGNGPILWAASLLIWCLYCGWALVARRQHVLLGAARGT